jgi:hypothetical protein
MNSHTEIKTKFEPCPTEFRKSLYINLPNQKSLCLIYRNASSLFLGLISEKYYNIQKGEQSFFYRKDLDETENPKWESYAIIRDPVERFMSSFALRSQHRNDTVDEFLVKLFAKDKETMDLHFRPQTILIGNNKPKLFDFNKDLEKLASELDLPTPLSIINKTNIGKPNLTKKQIDMIYEFYKEDKKLYDSFVNP